MSDDTYNGWKNRETWALNNWLTNDQQLYEMTRERVQGAMSRFPYRKNEVAPIHRARAGEAVKNFVAELTDPDESLMVSAQIIAFLSDVGSLYRVDWDEIGEAWLEDVEEDNQ